MRDEDLIEKIRAGDESSFRILIDQYRHYLFKTVFAVLRNEKEAEDATQEAFIKIYYALPQYEKQGLKAWMTRIAVNHAIDIRRKLRRQGEKIIEFTEEPAPRTFDSSIEVALLMKEQKERVRHRLKELPDNYRGVIQAYYIEDKSYKQIAEEQQIEMKTVEMKLYRARNWIRKHWKEEEF